MLFPSRSSPARIHRLIDELQLIENVLKTDLDIAGSALLELRQALDNIRFTAWTASQVQRGREIRDGTREVISFLTIERLTRFRKMIDELSADLQRCSWPEKSLEDFQESATLLGEKLALLCARRGKAAAAESK